MQELMAWSLFGLFVCNFLTLICLAALAIKLIQVMKQFQKESAPAISSARVSLTKVENVAETTEAFLRESVTTVLTNVKRTAQAVTQSVEGVRRVVGRVEDAVSKPIRAISAAGNVLDTPAGKASLLALGMGIAGFTIRSKRAHQARDTEPIAARRTNGASAASV